MGNHDKAIRKIEYCGAVNAILTGGWDAAVKLWDPRTPTCVGNYLQPDVVLALSVCGDKFVVGTAKRKVCIWDLRNMAGMFQRRESSLKYQTRCIKGFPNEQVRQSATFTAFQKFNFSKTRINLPKIHAFSGVRSEQYRGTRSRGIS